MKKYFSKNLCEFREEKGLTQVQIARRLGISVSTYANWEQGRREPSIENIMYLCALFDCEPNDLFEWNEELKFSLQADLHYEEEENKEQSIVEDELEDL